MTMRWLGEWIQLHNADDQTADWMAKARTPAARARIRRWSRVETIGVFVALGGFAALFVAPVVTLLLAIWIAVTGNGRTDVYWWLWGVVLGVSLVGAIGITIGSRQRLNACFADGQVAVGTLKKAIEHPGSGDDHTWYDLRISVELQDGTTLRRRLHREGADPGRRVGGPVRFRHNTLDPDDLDDILFVSFAGLDDGKSSRR